MKIKKTSSGTSAGVKTGSTSGRGSHLTAGEGVRSTSFLDELTAVEKDGVKKELNDILTEIDSQGELLKKSASLEVFTRYKELIQLFMKEVQTKLYKIEEKPSVRYIQNQKVFIVVKKINEALEEFTKDLMNKQADRLAMVKRVDEIRGLLMDLVI